MSEAIVMFLNRHRSAAGLSFAALLVVAAAELLQGRLLLGPDGRFGWWDGDIWSSENSQRVADAYSFSHICHGMLSYGVLFLMARRLPPSHRFLMAVAVECAWEILENSPVIIDRYREATISIGYVGDSVLNSVCDVLFMSLGFFVASRVRIRTAVALFLAMEIGCLVWVRDNLTLNIIMLIHPVEAIKVWQAEGHAGG
jgi:hypothetical protein